MSQPEQREEAVFEAALQLPTEQRAAYLDQACAGGPEARRRVEALLGAFERAGGFLKQPAMPTSARTLAASLPHTEKPGDKIGRYKLLQHIGEGGCGVVYMAEQEEMVRRRVALKVIKLGMDTKSVIARFEAERQALAIMDHPNIARVLDAGATDTGRPYFVMELVRGIKITDFCDENKLSTQDRLKLFIQVCQAIQHAHQKGIIHRDIKPSNILVTINDGVPVPKVIDFGIAKATAGRLTDQTLFTAFDQFIGTPAYMSPEQAVMTSLDIDTRSDIYSLGVLLYELLTGRTPFDQKELLAAGLDEMRRTIREKEPPKPSTCLTHELLAADLKRLTSKSEIRNPKSEDEIRASSRRLLQIRELISVLRGDLDWIVMKCLEKDRTRRYEATNDLASDIHRHLNNEPVKARPPSRIYRIQKLVRRNKLGVGAAVSVFVALLAGFSVATVMYFKAKIALSDLRKTAPAYIAQVHTLFAEQKVDEAMAKLDFALRLVPNDADYHLLRANKLQALQRLPDAISAYRLALAIQPTNIAAADNLRLCESLVRDLGTNLSAGARVTLYSAIKSQGRGEDLWSLQRLIGQEAEAAKGLIEARLRPLMTQPTWNGPSFNTGKTRIAQLADGTFGVDLSRLTLSDLTPLRGLPITELFLHACQVSDLSPLAGMPLRRVVIGTTRVHDLRPFAEAPLESLVASGSPIEDLSPLRGKRLVWLNLNNTRVRDLSPLRGAPLETLSLIETPVESLEPLAGMPLKHLRIQRCAKIKDITPLAGLPLEELDLGECPNINDLSPLVRCAKLEKLIVPGQCRDLESLRRIPNLKRVADRTYSTDNNDWNAVPLAEDFFRRLAGRIAREDEISPQLEKLRAELRRMKLVEYRVNEIKFSPDGTLDIDLAKVPFTDLSPLAGLPVKRLLLGRTRVQDLTALRGAPLEYVDLYQCPVTDLSPLTQCSNLLTLRIAGTDVTDLTPVLHLPLEELTLEGTLVADVSALAGCKTLKRLILPRRATGIEALRGHPKLERICFEWKWSIGFHQTAEEFWAEYDQTKSQR